MLLKSIHVLGFWGPGLTFTLWSTVSTRNRSGGGEGEHIDRNVRLEVLLGLLNSPLFSSGPAQQLICQKPGDLTPDSQGVSSFSQTALDETPSNSSIKNSPAGPRSTLRTMGTRKAARLWRVCCAGLGDQSVSREANIKEVEIELLQKAER